jgi:hypothetical protein
MRNFILAFNIALALVSSSAHAGPTVIANGPVTVPSGAAITAAVVGGPGNRGDWVGVFAVGAVARATSRVSWKWLSTDLASPTQPLTGVTTGTVHLVVPAQPGQYEVRFFVNNSWTSPAKSAPISVAPLQVSVTGVMADCTWVPGTPILTLSVTGGNGKPVTYTFGQPAPTDLAIKGNTLVIGPTGITPANCHTIEHFEIIPTQSP